MYVEYFKLRELPFNNTPDPRFFFPTSDHEEALASLIYAVKERKGFVLLTGEVGAGKTLVSRLMLRHFGSAIAFANVNHGVQTGRDLLEAVCAEFELNIASDASLTQLVRTLHDFLLDRFAQDIPVVLVLDEAQNLPVDAFEQLRMIGNLEADDAKLLQIAIVGQPELQSLFASHQLRQLRQRVFRSFHLPALGRDNTQGYIRHRLTVAGAQDPDIFTVDAIDRICTLSNGLPRLINTICDNALLSAYSADRKTIDGPFLASVIEQMMLLDANDKDEVHALHGGKGSNAEPMAVQPRFLTACDPFAASCETIPASRNLSEGSESVSPSTSWGPAPSIAAQHSPSSLKRPLEPEVTTCDEPGKVETEAMLPNRAQLICFARKELDALRAALHGPLRRKEQPRVDPRIRSSPEFKDAEPLAAQAVTPSDVEPAAQRLQSLIAQAECSSHSLLQREEKLRAVAQTIEGLAANLRGLLGRYQRTVGWPEGRASTPERETQHDGSSPSDGHGDGQGVQPRSIPRVSVRSSATESPKRSGITPSNRESVTEAGAAVRAKRLAQTLYATRENLARLRTLAPANSNRPPVPRPAPQNA